MENLKTKIQLLLNLYKSKNLSKAELLSKKLISAHPQVVNLYNVLGLILTEQKKTDEAIEYYEKGIKIDPNYAVIYNNLGSIYQSKENYKKAEDYFKKSIDLDSKMPEAQNNLGNLYLTLNNFLTPIIVIVLFPVHLILQPIFLKKLIKSLISGSIAQFFKIVFPFAKLEAIIKFSVAPTDILENFIILPINPFGAFA